MAASPQAYALLLYPGVTERKGCLAGWRLPGQSLYDGLTQDEALYHWTLFYKKKKKLAKTAEFQEASGETSLAGVVAEFLAAKAEAGESQPTPCGYNTAVRAAEDLGWIGPVVHQLHKRIAQAASKVGLQPYLPPEGFCFLLERAEL